MMIDGEGCWAILGILAFVSFVIGLIVMWVISGPWWIPLAALAVVPIACGIVIAVFSMLWMDSGSH